MTSWHIKEALEIGSLIVVFLVFLSLPAFNPEVFWVLNIIIILSVATFILGIAWP